jgi:dihydrofolate reductase
MAKLIYSALTSLDGYVADEDGAFDWAAPDEEVHTFFNDRERPVGTYLYGRRMYEVMVAWESPQAVTSQPTFVRDFAAIWQGAEKIVYSRTLDAVSSARTLIERTFDPEAIRRMKSQAGRDITVGGPHLAAYAMRAGLVDEYNLFVAPRGGRRGELGLARRGPGTTGAAGRAPFRQWRGLSPVPHPRGGTYRSVSRGICGRSRPVGPGKGVESRSSVGLYAVSLVWALSRGRLPERGRSRSDDRPPEAWSR